MITPPVEMLTVPFATVITCAIPGVSNVPLIEIMVKVSLSASLSPFNGVKFTGPSSATV